MSTEKPYPVVPMFKDGEHPQYARDPQHLEALKKEGWTEEYRNIGPQLYPKALYQADGVVVRAESPEHEAELLAGGGLSVKPIAMKQDFVETKGRKNDENAELIAAAVEKIAANQANSAIEEMKAIIEAQNRQIAEMRDLIVCQSPKPKGKKEDAA